VKNGGMVTGRQGFVNDWTSLTREDMETMHRAKARLPLGLQIGNFKPITIITRFFFFATFFFLWNSHKIVEK
jgi:hypothetical protein